MDYLIRGLKFFASLMFVFFWFMVCVAFVIYFIEMFTK